MKRRHNGEYFDFTTIPTGRRPDPILPRVLLLGLVIFVSYAWFYQGGGWNQNSRFDLVRALVEQGSLSIDAYVSNTGDFASYQGHSYSDKAPGSAFTAVAAVALLHGLGLTEPVALSYLATLMGACLPGALAAALVYACARRLESPPSAALFASLCVAWGTPFWCYSTMLFGHALAAACMMAAFYLALNRQGRLAWGLGLGLCCGWAVVTEYSTAPLCLLIVLWAAVRVCEGRPRLALGVALGAAACAAVLGAYHRSAFGGIFEVGYAHVSRFPEMSRGLFGLSWPRPEVILEILFGPYRGLFYASPILLAAPWGLARGPGRLILALVGVQVLLTSSYAYWDGGWAYGPRHLIPIVPLLGLGLAPVYQRAGRRLRRLLLAVALLSGVMNLVAVATLPMPPQARADLARQDPTLYRVWRHPLRLHLWPSFVAGDLAQNRNSVLELGTPTVGSSEKSRAAWNLGQRLGLPGQASLLPLLALGAALGVAWNRPIRCSWLYLWRALPMLAVGLACLPLLLHSALPHSSDASYHLQGIRGLAASLQEGQWFARWVADCNGGYGAPIFVFYPPLGSLCAATLAVLLGSTLEGLRWAWVFWLAAAALSFYLSVRPLYGQRAASLGACLYTLLPYHLFDLYDRGALGEFVGMVWLPPLLALCESETKGRSGWLALVLVMAALLLSHPMLAMLSAVAWAGWAVTRRSRLRQQGLPLLLSLLLALGLSAFYWLPMLTEAPRVQMQSHFAQDHYHWQRNLLFRVESEYGYERDVCKPWATMAATTTLLLTLGGMALGPATARPWAALSLLSFFLQTPLSAPLWEHLPWLYRAQFPWRFGALQSVGCCLLWAAVLKAYPGRRTGWLLAALAGPALLGAAVLSLRARPFDLGPSLAESSAYRQRSVPEYTPRIDPGTSLEQTSLCWSEVALEGEVMCWEQQRRQLTLRLTQPGPVWLRTLAYPGWRVLLDQESAPLLPGSLLGVLVPAGSHGVEFRFESTPQRSRAGWLSLAAAGIWLGLFLWPERKPT